MKTEAPLAVSEFDYDLPQGLIAQYPLAERTQSRLLVLNRGTGGIVHKRFLEILEFFRLGDVLVLNDTRVFPARLWARKPTGGRIEILLLRELEKNVWEALVQPSQRVAEGLTVTLDGGGATGTFLDEPHSGPGSSRRISVNSDGDFSEFLEKEGHIPLPPYIRRQDEPLDRERYQTVFAKQEGAVAAPTAGLHFDEPLLAKLRAAGVSIVTLTLHVGYGTFQPVREEDITRHAIHSEYFKVTQEAAVAINDARRNRGRIFACGTTTVRALESAATEEGPVCAREGWTQLFIYPPYPFRTFDHLITNFHLPRSTLLMLVSAFAGKEALFLAYEEAIRAGYRFYSYGDAMLIL
jgi:S-adenosylmethionine:tRNA ribosyltransferase-isomerase